MKRMMILAKSSISLFLITEGIIIASNIISYSFFINAQVAFLSAFLILLGSIYSYKKVVTQKLEAGFIADDRDELDKIDDPYDLYDDEEKTASEDLKTVIQEERAKLKKNGMKNAKVALGATASLYRLVPYIVLVFGFIALKNNDILTIKIYLPFLAVGIFVGYTVGQRVFSSPTA